MYFTTNGYYGNSMRTLDIPGPSEVCLPELEQLRCTTKLNVILKGHFVCTTALLHAGQDVCFCLNGGFYSTRYPSCRCPPGFGGTFCEYNYNLGE